MENPSHFRALRRAFLRGFLEHEDLAARGDFRDLLTNVVAVLAAFGICIGFLLVKKYVFGVSQVPVQARAALAWGDVEFLMSMTVAVSGIFVIVCWDALFPNRTDCMVLTALPVRPRTVMAAKLVAVFTVFWFLVGAANAVPVLLFPVLMITNGMGGNAFFWFAAQFTATAGAALFLFAAAAALQGVLINVLPYRLFRRASAACQLAAVFLLLAMFFATPDLAGPDRLAAPENRVAITVLPSFWFLGLYEAMLGSRLPVVVYLARIALGATGLSVAIAAISYWAGYARYVRKTVEDSGATTPSRTGPAVFSKLANALVVRTAGERAVFHFTWRTMVRSRTHRLILAAYMSVGLAYLAMGSGNIMSGRGVEEYLRPDAATGGVPIVLSFFAVVAMRALFSLPVELRANWLFKLTEAATPARTVRSVRKLMFVAGVLPAVVFSAAVYPALWGWATGLRFSGLVLLVLLIVLEKLMREFHKIPFACSYLPGKTNLKLTFVIYVVLFMMAAWTVTNLSVSLAGSNLGFLWGVGLGVAWLGWRWWRNRREPGWPGFQYEETPEWQPVTLELT